MENRKQAERIQDLENSVEDLMKVIFHLQRELDTYRFCEDLDIPVEVEL